MKIAVIIVAGGVGARLGSAIPKQYVDINGKLLAEYSLERFTSNKKINYVQLVVNRAHESYYRKTQLSASSKFLDIAETEGEFRQNSVFSGLKVVEKYEPDYVLIHDAARPLVSDEIIDSVIQSLECNDAVAPAIELTDTIGVKDGDLLKSTPNRDSLVAIQTPQGFNFKKIIECHRRAEAIYSDDVSLAMSFGVKAKIIPGDRLNFKVTDLFDLNFLSHLLDSYVKNLCR